MSLFHRKVPIAIRHPLRNAGHTAAAVSAPMWLAEQKATTLLLTVLCFRIGGIWRYVARHHKPATAGQPPPPAAAAPAAAQGRREEAEIDCYSRAIVICSHCFSIPPKKIVSHLVAVVAKRERGRATYLFSTDERSVVPETLNLSGIRWRTWGKAEAPM